MRELLEISEELAELAIEHATVSSWRRLDDATHEGAEKLGQICVELRNLIRAMAARMQPEESQR